MNWEKRHWLDWNETANALGLDGEGLRQQFAYGTLAGSRSMWLPGFIQSSLNLRFFGVFGFDGFTREVVRSVDNHLVLVPKNVPRRDGPEPHYPYSAEIHSGANSSQLATKPFKLRNDGHTETLAWTATHDHGTRWNNCYTLSGRMVLHPEALAVACESGGYFDDLMPVAAPIEWCRDDQFPEEYFRLELSHELRERAYAQSGKPQLATLSTVEECVLFRPDDVRKALSNSKTKVAPTQPNVGPRPQYEQNLLRVIAGLWELSGLPKEHNTTAEKLSMLFDAWGWDGPAKSTIADRYLKVAAKLDRKG